MLLFIGGDRSMWRYALNDWVALDDVQTFAGEVKPSGPLKANVMLQLLTMASSGRSG